MHSTGAVGAINMERLNLVSSIIEKCDEFNRNVYLPDVIAIGGFYKSWLYGGGLSSKACLAYGDIPENPNDFSPEQLHLPRGAIINGDLSQVHDVDVRDPEQVQEFVDHSWYEYGEAGKGLHPWDGVTEAKFELGPNLKGTRTNIKQIDEGAKYSWIKAPRWRGHAMEVGPLARYIVGYAKGHEEITDQVTGLLRKMDLPTEALFSTLGRTAARALESEYCGRLQGTSSTSWSPISRTATKAPRMSPSGTPAHGPRRPRASA